MEQICNWDGQLFTGQAIKPYDDREWTFCEAHWAEHQKDIGGLHLRDSFRRMVRMLARLIT